MRSVFAISLTACLTAFLATLWSLSPGPHDVGSRTLLSDATRRRNL